MKVGDTVVHTKAPQYGKGRIISFKAFQGTIFVRWENVKTLDGLMYHIPQALKKVKNEGR